MLVLLAALAGLAAAAPPTLEGGPRELRWMTPAKLGGAIPSGRERERFVVEQQPCGRPWERDFAFFSGPGGRWQLDFYPPITTSYRVRWNDEVSRVLTVRVRPGVVLRESRPKGRFVVTVTATREFDGLAGTIERRDRGTGRWTTMKTFRFTESGQAGQMRMTKGYVAVNVPRGTLVRAVLPAASARPCYLAGFSNFFTTT